MRIIFKFFSQPIIICSLIIYFFSILTGAILSKEVDFSFYNGDFSFSPLHYFQHNLVSCIILISGIAVFSLSTLWSLFLNGVMLGATFVGVAIEKSIQEAIASIFFHGIFEIPAIILSGAIGLYPIYLIYLLLRNKKEIDYKNQIKSIGIMLALIVVFLIIASIMEAKVSPLVINYFFK